MNKSISHRSVELNISGDKQCLRFIMLNITVFENVVVSWREFSCWLSLLKPVLQAWWLAPRQVLHSIHPYFSYFKIYWLKIWLIIKLDLQHSVLHLGRLKGLLFLRLYCPVVFLGSNLWSLWDLSSLIPAKVFIEMTSLLSLGVDRPDSLRAAVYAYSSIDLIQVT